MIRVHKILLLANDIEVTLNRIEEQLEKQHGITADSADLQRQLNELTAWQVEYDELLARVQKFKNAAAKLEEAKFIDSNKFLDHWRVIGEEIENRIHTLSDVIPKTVLLKDCLFDESKWLKETYQKLLSDRSIPSDEKIRTDLLETYKVYHLNVFLFIRWKFCQ